MPLFQMYEQNGNGYAQYLHGTCLQLLLYSLKDKDDTVLLHVPFLAGPDYIDLQTITRPHTQEDYYYYAPYEIIPSLPLTEVG